MVHSESFMESWARTTAESQSQCAAIHRELPSRPRRSCETVCPHRRDSAPVRPRVHKGTVLACVEDAAGRAAPATMNTLATIARLRVRGSLGANLKTREQASLRRRTARMEPPRSFLPASVFLRQSLSERSRISVPK